MKQYIVGHRGAAGLAPENTLKAFRIGCQSNAAVVECDIHLTKDKKLIVIHDGTLDRTTNGTGWIKDYTFEELRKLDAGEGEKIPTLEEVVELVLSYKKKLIIEIKAEDKETAQEQTKAFTQFLLARQEIIPNIYLHTFWHGIVPLIKQNFPDLQLFANMMIGLTPEQMLQLILDASANGAAIEQDYISLELVEKAHEKGIHINSWLSNDEYNFNKMKNMGVDGIITNFPDKFSI